MSSHHTDDSAQIGEIESSSSKQPVSLLRISGDLSNSFNMVPVNTVFLLNFQPIDDVTKSQFDNDVGESSTEIVSSSKNNIPNRGPIKKQTFYCPICEEIFELRRILNDHILETHKGSQGYKCNICGKGYITSDGLSAHVSQHKKDGIFKCDKCDKIFRRKLHLFRHKKSKHVPVTVCEYCGKNYKTHTALRTHKYRHHPLVSSSSVCEVCGKSFLSKAYLLSHMATHDQEKASCSICNKTFPHKRALKVHIRFVHVTKKKSICTVCNKEFKHSTTLQNHIHFKHNNGEKPKCNICDAVFSNKTALQTHTKMIHIGLTPHACKHCKQEFKWKQTCIRHEEKCLGEQKEEGESGSDSK